ncbi:hypothetical protein U1Q18_049765 [Sarracenia purpurea var. burkii]
MFIFPFSRFVVGFVSKEVFSKALSGLLHDNQQYIFAGNSTSSRSKLDYMWRSQFLQAVDHTTSRRKFCPFSYLRNGGLQIDMVASGLPTDPYEANVANFADRPKAFADSSFDCSFDDFVVLTASGLAHLSEKEYTSTVGINSIAHSL